jgi:hypothetical protein
VIDHAITSTMSRTIITHGSTEAMVLSMLFFGGPSLHYFALALTIGILFGIYSSVFVAAAIAMWLGVKREDLVKAPKDSGSQRSQRRRRGVSGVLALDRLTLPGMPSLPTLPTRLLAPASLGWQARLLGPRTVQGPARRGPAAAGADGATGQAVGTQREMQERREAWEHRQHQAPG